MIPMYIGFVIKYEWTELVECKVHLPNMVKNETLIGRRAKKEKWNI